jgi:hypothetical protein
MYEEFQCHLIREGWNPDVEIKASKLWHAPKSELVPVGFKYKNDRETPMGEILTRLGTLDLRIEYLVVRLCTVKEPLQKIKNCRLYNYFAWQLLRGPLTFHSDIDLYIDKRNRENHDLLSSMAISRGRLPYYERKRIAQS